MSEPLLYTELITRSFGGLLAVNKLSLTFRRGQVHAIIGPNGAGKTTLISQLSGSLRPDSGRIFFQNQDITQLPEYRRSSLGLARSFQITSVLQNFSALDNVALAVQAKAGHSFSFWSKARKATHLRDPALKILEKLNGQKHQLISSVCISKNGTMIWNYTDKAILEMKNFSEHELKDYLSKISDKNLYAYNVYQIEGEGRKLFSRINGDEDTIMGLPVKKIKEYLKEIR